jgi:hypothetical protein
LGVRTSRFDLKRPITADQRTAAIERMRSKCITDEKGCWVWQRWKNKIGYGTMSFHGESWMIHRLMWVLSRRAIPKGMFVCHTCDNPSCINPYHLFIGDHTTNQRDMIAKGRHAKGSKTHCSSGHEFTPENTLVTTRHGYSHRHCKLCQRIRQRIKAGWSREQAESITATTPGKRPVGATWPRGCSVFSANEMPSKE